jgi:uncharacterized protein YfaS (alpha-2-macroglobulin family)
MAIWRKLLHGSTAGWRAASIPGIIAALAGLFLAGCSTGTAALAPPDGRFVHAHTGGVVSVADPVTVEFVDRVQGSVDDRSFLASALSFEPAIAGSAAWRDANTLVFTPAKPLVRGVRYLASFHAGQLKESHPAARDFSFAFTASPQAIEVSLGSLRSAGDPADGMEESGTVTTRDTEDAKAVESLLWVSGAGGSSIAWNHDAEGRTHRFTISGIARGASDREITVAWNGSRVGAGEKGERKLLVPSAGRFELLEAGVVQADDSYLDLVFSDPVDPSQDLRGLVSFKSDEGRSLTLKPVVDRNRIKVYTVGKWPAKGTVSIEAGVRSYKNVRLVAGSSKPVAFPSQKPAVRFAGTGVIVPTTQGLTVPVETMNLKYLMVEATRVYHTNIPQFLQVNNLAGTRELYRVGRVVWRQVVDLGWKPDNQDRWVRSGLDLAKLLAANPDGLFRIKLTFRMNHVVWNDATGSGDPAQVDWIETAIPDANEEDSYWDYSESENAGLQYSQRKNPANPSYYHAWSDHNIDATRSVMVSDLGLIASRGTDGALDLAAADLRSAQPLAGLELSVLDYTMHPIATATTDASGFARFASFAERPFFVVGKSGGQYAYLRLGDSDARTVSSFDVAGEASAAGIKGFLYGERGVWRPGDTIWLNFILQDPRRSLPADHPVSLELFNPQGQQYGSWTSTKGLNGFYHFPVATSANAPTGNWLARVKVGGSSWEKTLKVETVMPNRLKIDFSLTDSPNGVTGNYLQAHLGAKWLTGVKSPGLKAQVQVSLTPTETTFPGRPELNGYSFDDPTRIFSAEKQTVFDGTLDKSGGADFESEIAVESQAPGKLRANFDTRVYEPGGAFSVDAFSVDFHPYERYVGVKPPAGDVARGMLLTDTDHPLQIVVVGPDGKPVSGKARLRAEIFKMNWRWWWEGGEDAEQIAEYIADRSLRPIKTETLELANGKGQWKFRVAYPEWGRFLIRVTDLEGNHAAGVIKYIDWPGWAGRNQKDGPGGAAILQLTTDKTGYKSGETVSVSIPGNTGGRALVSIEKGGRAIREEWLEPSGPTSVYRFTATPDMAPNIYVHVTFLQPHLQTRNDLPIRTYGIVPVLVENANSRLAPKIECDDTFKPGALVSLKVSETRGRPMTYTLALVDEGLLGLTRFKTPNPWDAFYQREASLLRTWDLYDFVAGAFTGTLENMLAIGGSDEGWGGGERKADRFPPLVRCLPPANLAAGETKEVKIQLPEYVGAVRVMVVAGDQPAGEGTFAAYGTAEKSVQVKKEIMVLGTLPRVLSPGEEADVPVSLFYLGETKRNVPVTLALTGQLSIVGQASQLVAFDGPGEKIASFRVKAKDAAGIGTVRISAKGATDSALQDIELDVRPPTNPVTVALMPGSGGTGAAAGGSAIGGGQAWTLDRQALPGTIGSNSLKLELSTMPPIDLGKRLDYLIQYPHGCIEQTTSGVFPQLYLASLMELPPERQAEIQGNVQAGIQRLLDFQVSSGGFSYWPGQGDQANPWGTSYAGHFLLEAKRAGYAVPASMLSAWSQYQRDAANSWNDRTPAGKIDQSYRLYTLALDGSADLAALNRLREIALPDQAAWRLAAAYLLVGQANVARELVQKASPTVKRYRELGATFGSDLRDRAMILESMSLLDMNSQALSLARDIAGELSKDQWLSTQETAYALLSLSRVVGLIAGNGKVTVSYTIKDSAGGPASRTISSTKPVLVVNLPLSAAAADFQFELKNTGGTPVFPRLLMSGIPAPGQEKEQKQGLALKVKYYDANGADLLAPDNLAPGTDVYAEILVQNLSLTQNYEQIALTHLGPSGFEIVNDRMGAAGQDEESAAAQPAWFARSAKIDGRFDWQDIRDDRVYTYFGLPKLGQKLFRVHLVAAYKGKYYLPSIKAEAMYDAGISALVPGYWVGIGEKMLTTIPVIKPPK